MPSGLTDEQIRTALDYVNDYKKEAMAYDTSVGIFPPTSEEVRALETVETALRQYQKPSEWIPVSERLPTYWESSPGNQIVAWAIHNDPYPRGKAYMTQYSGGWYYFGTNRKITGVTHWKIERGPESEVKHDG